LVPGSELIGMGIDVKVGLDLNALRRSCMRLRQVETMVLPDVNGVKSYSVPSWQIARRLFKADLTTKVFDSVQESLFDLAASAAVQFSVGMFSGEASAKVEITKAADKTTYLSSTKLDVQLVHLVSAKFVPEDLNQDMLAEFNALPTT